MKKAFLFLLIIFSYFVIAEDVHDDNTINNEQIDSSSSIDNPIPKHGKTKKLDSNNTKNRSGIYVDNPMRTDSRVNTLADYVYLTNSEEAGGAPFVHDNPGNRRGVTFGNADLLSGGNIQTNGTMVMSDFGCPEFEGTVFLTIDPESGELHDPVMGICEWDQVFLGVPSTLERPPVEFTLEDYETTKNAALNGEGYVFDSTELLNHDFNNRDTLIMTDIYFLSDSSFQVKRWWFLKPPHLNLSARLGATEFPFAFPTHMEGVTDPGADCTNTDDLRTCGSYIDSLISYHAKTPNIVSGIDEYYYDTTISGPHGYSTSEYLTLSTETGLPDSSNLLSNQIIIPDGPKVIYIMGGPVRVHGLYKGKYTVITDEYSTYHRHAWPSNLEAPIDTLWCNIWITDDIRNADTPEGNIGPPQPDEFCEQGSNNRMGLISGANIIVANTRANGAGNQTNGSGVVIHASLVAINESFTVQYWQNITNGHFSPPHGDGRGPWVNNFNGFSSNQDARGTITIWGGITQKYRGYIIRNSPGPYNQTVGYQKSYHFDENNFCSPPPYFPAIHFVGEGCSDPYAINYNPEATFDDGSCYYIEDINQHFVQNWEGIPLNPMGIYVNSAILDEINLRVGDEIGIFDVGECIGVAQLTDEITTPVQLFLSQDNPDTPEIDGFIGEENIVYKFWDASEQIEIISVSPTILNGDDVFTPLGFSEVELSVYTILGCTQISSINYNPDATVDDGSCIIIIYGCMDSEACNYDPDANEEGSCVYYDCTGECNGGAFFDDCDVCDDDPSNDNECYGCSDQWALNYDPSFTIDDGSCDYPSIGDISMDGFINVNDIVLLVGVVLDGEDYVDYMDINQDSYLNIIDIVILVDIILNPESLGCTDPNAPNFNPDSIYDDGSCDYSNLVIDIDGNVYETVVIGNQEWMAENLMVTRYRNGEEILTDFSSSEWGDLDDTETGAFAVYNDDLSNVEVYGNLYNWYAIGDAREICPEGWHIPTDDEWMELEMYLGMSYEDAHDTGYRGTDQGSQLAGNSDLWIDGSLENSSEFGSSGFLALPGGYRGLGGIYDNVEWYCSFWSFTATNSDYAWSRKLNYGNSKTDRNGNNKRNGFSLRCAGD
jgi:uncharacterized protein (TIGR02145 family)